MSYRKSYNDLSQRQKCRRIAAACDESDESDESDDENLNEDQNPTSDMPDTEISANDSCIAGYSFERELNDRSIDLVTEEYNKLFLETEENEFNDSYDSDSSDSEINDSRENVELNIKNRLRAFIANSNLADTHANTLLIILRDAGLSYVPKDVRTLKKTPRQTSVVSCPPGEYFHYGLETAIKDVIPKKTKSQEIQIDINIDGLPISKSPPISLWPILGKIVGDRSQKVMIIGLYKGKEKPKSIFTYLDPFINEFLQLKQNGFIYNGRRYTINIRCLICDSPAASYLLNTKQFNGYYGCRKCTIEGKWKSRMVFLDFNEPLRTNDTFRARAQQEHHHGNSPLEQIPNFDMIKQVPLDYMHLLCLSVTKLIIRLWINPRTKPHLNIVHLSDISSAFLSLSPWVPKEFNRKPQPLLELKSWKATTFRFFLLYAGPIILQKILPKEYIEHFNVLNCASRILCSSSLALDNEMTDYAKKLLQYFVQTFMALYDEKWVTWNLHSLIHITDDVKEYGSLDNFSAFPYENYMQTIKRMIRKKSKQLQQIHRRLVEKNCINSNESTKKIHYPIMSQPVYKNLPVNCYSSHKSLKFENFELKDSRPNNCYISYDDEVILIDSICKKNDQIIIIGRQFLDKQKMPNYPLESTAMGFYEVRNMSAQQIFPVHNVKNKMCLFIYDLKSYAVQLLHH